MSTTGWIVALVFGFGVVFYIFGNRDTKEAYNAGAAQIDAQQAEFLARRARTIDGKADPELEKQASEARAKATSIATRNEVSSQERELTERAVEGQIESAYGIKPATPPVALPTPAQPSGDY